MKYLILTIALSSSLLAQVPTLGIDLSKLNNEDIDFSKLNQNQKIEKLKIEINEYNNILKKIDNVQLKDGTVIDINDLKLPNSFRESFGTGGGG